jgi:hypothetical protein
MERWIVAAHPDDELLGLGGLIRDRTITKVIYADTPLSALRFGEAEELGRLFDFEVTLGTMALTEAPRGVQVFVHSPLDTHPDHQAVLSDVATILAVREDFEVREYKVGGGAPYTEAVSDALVDWKMKVFARVYRSQAKMLRDPKFFLFEGHALLGTADITVTFSVAGFHQWKEAPAEVSYLRARHRHLFNVRLSLVGLYRQDRQEEFHLVQEWAQNHFEHVVKAGGSCETMARRMALLGRARYAVPCEVEVWEDNECGGRVRI